MARNRYVEDDNGREVSLAGLAREHARGLRYEFDDREEPDFDIDAPADDEETSPSGPVDFSAQVHNVRPQQQIHQSPAAQKRTNRY